MEELYTIAEAARYLKCSKDTVRRYIREKKLKAYRAGGRYRIRRTDLEQFLQEPPPAPPKPLK